MEVVQGKAGVPKPFLGKIVEVAAVDYVETAMLISSFFLIVLRSAVVNKICLNSDSYSVKVEVLGQT